MDLDSRLKCLPIDSFLEATQIVGTYLETRKIEGCFSSLQFLYLKRERKTFRSSSLGIYHIKMPLVVLW